MINRLVMVDAPDGESYSLVRLTERVPRTRTLYVAECLDPKTGGPLGFGSYLVDLRLLMLRHGEGEARGRIFDDFAAVQAFVNWTDGPPREKVVRLVKP